MTSCSSFMHNSALPHPQLQVHVQVPELELVLQVLLVLVVVLRPLLVAVAVAVAVSWTVKISTHAATAITMATLLAAVATTTTESMMQTRMKTRTRTVIGPLMTAEWMLSSSVPCWIPERTVSSPSRVLQRYPAPTQPASTALRLARSGSSTRVVHRRRALACLRAIGVGCSTRQRKCSPGTLLAGVRSARCASSGSAPKTLCPAAHASFNMHAASRVASTNCCGIRGGFDCKG